jgi:hypothetical protein
MTIPIVIYTTKNFYLVDEINERLTLFSSTGLVNFWRYQSINLKSIRVSEESSPRVLTFESLRGCFEVLFVGCAVASLTFLIELIVTRLKTQSGIAPVAEALESLSSLPEQIN